MHLLRRFIVSHLDWHSQFRRLVMRSLQVIQLEDFNHSPFIFPVVFPFDQSFYLITSVTEITPLPSTVPGNTIVIYVVACSCPWSSTQVTLFWIPPPPFSSSSTYLFTEPNSPEWLPSYTRLSPGISWRQCPVLFLCSIHTHHVLMFSVW